MRDYPHPDTPVAAGIDEHAAGGAIEQTRFDQDTARRRVMICSTEEARSVNILSLYDMKEHVWLATC